MGLREANQKFAQAIRAVRRGREVVLTDRGRPLAVIRPIAAGDADRLNALAAEGLVRPAELAQEMPAPRWRAEPGAGESIAATIDRDRDESV